VRRNSSSQFLEDTLMAENNVHLPSEMKLLNGTCGSLTSNNKVLIMERKRDEIQIADKTRHFDRQDGLRNDNCHTAPYAIAQEAPLNYLRQYSGSVDISHSGTP
jgi:hypothetical protein